MTAGLSAPIWMIVAAGAAIALAVSVFAHLGVGKIGTETALRLTARLAFLLFWPSYVGGALVTLIGWLCWIGSAPSVKTFAIFGMAVLWTYLLALFSIKRLGQVVGSMGWWILRNIGMNYIAFAFALDFLPPLHNATARQLAAYLPFAVLAVLGPAARIVAALKPVGQGSSGR